MLVANENDARQARESLVAAGLHGTITVAPWQSDTLPFIDNFVNLLVVEEGTGVSRDEILRVLAPEFPPFRPSLIVSVSFFHSSYVLF